ncbi:MAG: hypothetical protein ACI9DF_004311, partial [Verrucomicrobiales bacterium]
MLRHRRLHWNAPNNEKSTATTERSPPDMDGRRLASQPFIPGRQSLMRMPNLRLCENELVFLPCRLPPASIGFQSLGSEFATERVIFQRAFIKKFH